MPLESSGLADSSLGAGALVGGLAGLSVGGGWALLQGFTGGLGLLVLIGCAVATAGGVMWWTAWRHRTKNKRTSSD